MDARLKELASENRKLRRSLDEVRLELSREMDARRDAEADAADKRKEVSNLKARLDAEEANNEFLWKIHERNLDVVDRLRAQEARSIAESQVASVRLSTQQEDEA